MRGTNTLATKKKNNPSMLDLLEELYEAYREARKNKRNTRSQLQFELNLEANLVGLAKELKNKSYQVGRSSCFVVFNPVQREIFAADFRDRVVHHFLVRRVGGAVEKNLIYDSYSCRKGKGTLFGVQRFHHHAKSCTANFTQPAWILKLDVQGYFMNIPRDLLYGQVIRMVGPCDSLTQYLVREIVFSDPTFRCQVRGTVANWIGLPKSKSLFHTPKGCGLPIGNLTSQLFSNVFLNPLDQYVKRALGFKHYGRYVDDFYMIHTDKSKLIAAVDQIDQFLQQELQLNLHPKKRYLQTVAHGVEFLGVKVKNGALIPGKRIRKNALKSSYQSSRLMAQYPERCTDKKSMEQVLATANSYLGVTHQIDGYHLRRRIVRAIGPPLANHLKSKSSFRSLQWIKPLQTKPV